jgi:hypothetical protein
VSLLYLAGGCLVVAQLIGVYGLVTRKADVIFSIVMGTLLAFALLLGAVWVYHHV